MVRQLSVVLAAFLLSFAIPAAAQKADAKKGTSAEATAMVDKAIAHIKKAGREKAFADFNNKSGPFVDRDLYVVVYDMKGKVLAHPPTHTTPPHHPPPPPPHPPTPPPPPPPTPPPTPPTP